ncbi:hypothetical protein [Prosthecobacter sp.]|uniref:hypothetical protein n=1 Tax=Prosthecobacter sp. TaxID=1965333 RepID=UPI00378358EC
MKTFSCANAAQIPTAAFFVVPGLYGVAYGLQAAFRVFDERFFLPVLLLVFPMMLFVNLCLSVASLSAAQPRTWWHILSAIASLGTCLYSLFLSLLAILFFGED